MEGILNSLRLTFSPRSESPRSGENSPHTSPPESLENSNKSISTASATSATLVLSAKGQTSPKAQGTKWTDREVGRKPNNIQTGHDILKALVDDRSDKLRTDSGKIHPNEIIKMAILNDNRELLVNTLKDSRVFLDPCALLAAELGNLELLKILLENVENSGSNLKSACLMAVVNGSSANSYLQQNTTLSSTSVTRSSRPTSITDEQGPSEEQKRKETLRWLINNGARNFDKAGKVIIHKRNLDQLRILVEYRLDLCDLKKMTIQCGKVGWVEGLRYLAILGDFHHSKVAAVAVKNGHLSILELLLELTPQLGAGKNCLNLQLLAPIALENGHAHLVHFLYKLDKGLEF